MANDNGYPRRILMVLLFVSSGFGGVRGGVKKSGLEPSRAQGALPKVCEAILDPKRRGVAHKNEILGVARRSARRRWGDIGGLKYLHFSFKFGGRQNREASSSKTGFGGWPGGVCGGAGRDYRGG